MQHLFSSNSFDDAKAVAAQNECFECVVCGVAAAMAELKIPISSFYLFCLLAAQKLGILLHASG